MFLLDGPAARALSGLSPPYEGAFRSIVRACEIVFAFDVTPYLYGVLLSLGGLALLPWPQRRVVGRVLLFVGLSHLTSRFLVDILKPPFSRLRPYEALAGGSWHDIWGAAVGNSFPSGHAAHFWGLSLPLIVLYPRQAVPLAVLPIIVSAARVAVNDHYIGDVLASMAVAAWVTAVWARIILRATRASVAPGR